MSSTLCARGTRGRVLPGYSECAMYEYLRTWRLHRQLTLEEVAAHLGVKHSTVSRWERGELPVNSKNLAALAALYECTDRELVGGPPADADTVRLIDEIQGIVADMAPDDRERWLGIGRSLRSKPLKE